MNQTHRSFPLALLLALAAVVVVAVVRPSTAGVGTISASDLSGDWQMTVIGQTGCGFGTTLYHFTLSTSGTSSNVSGRYHTVGCGDGTSTGNSFTVQTLNVNGSGTANLTCGPGCGWNLNIQVSADRSMFNFIDVSPVNPSNYIEGTAVHQ